MNNIREQIEWLTSGERKSMSVHEQWKLAMMLKKMHATLTEISEDSGGTEGAGMYMSDLASSTLEELE